jgi:hypothetical protein
MAKTIWVTTNKKAAKIVIWKTTKGSIN